MPAFGFWDLVRGPGTSLHTQHMHKPTMHRQGMHRLHVLHVLCTCTMHMHRQAHALALAGLFSVARLKTAPAVPALSFRPGRGAGQGQGRGGRAGGQPGGQRHNAHTHHIHKARSAVQSPA